MGQKRVGGKREGATHKKWDESVQQQPNGEVEEVVIPKFIYISPLASLIICQGGDRDVKAMENANYFTVWRAGFYSVRP